MMFARFLMLLFVLVVGARAADLELGLRDGEALTYRVAYGIFGNAGEIKIAANTEINDGAPFLSVVTTTSTRGFLRTVYPFQAQSDSIFDQRTGRMTVHTETSATSKKKTNFALEFDHTKSIALYTDFTNSANNQTLTLPPGNPMDLITSLVQTRVWDLKPGESRDINVMFDRDIYELTIYAVRYEKVRTAMGSFNTLVYEPRMEKTPPKGMFKRGSAVHVWISQDANRLPVKFEVEFKFGAGVANLIKYQPPKEVAQPETAAATTKNP
jgi:hypothetical protein